MPVPKGVPLKPRLPFNEAAKAVRALGIRSVRDFRKRAATHALPLGIPACPNITYSEDWKGWAYFLGNGWPELPYAQRVVQGLHFSSQKEYSANATRLGLPIDAPTVYKGKGWKGWRLFLGQPEQKWLRFADATAEVRKLDLPSVKVFWLLSANGLLPKGVPAAPHRHYKKEWKGFGYFLGTEKARKVVTVSDLLTKWQQNETKRSKTISELRRDTKEKTTLLLKQREEEIQIEQRKQKEELRDKNRALFVEEEKKKYALSLKLVNIATYKTHVPSAVLSRQDKQDIKHLFHVDMVSHSTLSTIYGVSFAEIKQAIK